MANISFGYPNRADEATLSGGSWQATLPRSNLQDRIIAHVARTADATLTSTKFDIQLAQSRSIGALALIGHNFGVLAKVRFRGADSQANLSTAPLYDSGWVDVWPAGAIPAALLEWEDDNFWLGTITAEARASYNTPFIHAFAASNQQWWRVEIDDTLNADGYVQVGRLFLSGLWSPTYNMSLGMTFAVEDRTVTEEAQGGTEFFDASGKHRVMNLALNWLDESEAYSSLLEIQRMLGISGELLVVPDSGDSTNGFRRNMVGRLVKISPIEAYMYQKYRSTLEIKELV